MGLATVHSHNTAQATQKIYAMGHRLEVIRIYASTISAEMIDLKTMGDGCYPVFISKPVCTIHTVSHAKISVSGRSMMRRRPDPTTRRFDYKFW